MQLWTPSKATSGYIFSIAWGVVSYKPKKQTILAQSTIKSEMISLTPTSGEASLLRSLLAEILFREKLSSVVLIYSDSIVAIAKIENRFFNGKRWQIRHKNNIVRELLSACAIRVNHGHTDENLVDHLTKGLSTEKFHNHQFRCDYCLWNHSCW